MQKKTFEIELTLTDGNLSKLYEMYLNINQDGLYDNFDDFIEEAINFRLLRHIFANGELLLDFIRSGAPRCEQT